MTIISWTPRDYLMDSVASGLLGGALAVTMVVLVARWALRRIHMRKVN